MFWGRTKWNSCHMEGGATCFGDEQSGIPATWRGEPQVLGMEGGSERCAAVCVEGLAGDVAGGLGGEEDAGGGYVGGNVAEAAERYG